MKWRSAGLPPGHIPDGFESCPRCGAMILSKLTLFHQCKGSDRSLRPANVTPEAWARADALGVAEFLRPPPPPEPEPEPTLEDKVRAADAYARRPLVRRSSPDYGAFAAAAVAVLLLVVMIAFALQVQTW